MKKIGIMARPDVLNKKNILYITENIYKYAQADETLTLIIPYMKKSDFKKLLSVINECDGIILPGGNDATKTEINIARYLHKNDIPTLGICLGMQVMSLALGGTLERLKTDSHKSDEKYVHKVILNNESYLYSILKKKIINVNSSHYYEITKTNLDIVARSLDGVVEAVEDPYKRFFIGVQWHPEKTFDLYSSRLIKAFINSLM